MCERHRIVEGVDIAPDSRSCDAPLSFQGQRLSVFGMKIAGDALSTVFRGESVRIIDSTRIWGQQRRSELLGDGNGLSLQCPVCYLLLAGAAE